MLYLLRGPDRVTLPSLKGSIVTLAVLVLLTASCTTTQILVNPAAKVDTLHIYLKGLEQVPSFAARTYERSFDDFIIGHNSRIHKFKAIRVSSPHMADLTVTVLGLRLVKPEEQTAGFVVSMLGLSLPFIMVASGAEFYIAFWYFPKVSSLVEFELSKELTGNSPNPQRRLVRSGGFLRSPEKQVLGQSQAFNRILTQVVGEMERSLKK